MTTVDCVAPGNVNGSLKYFNPSFQLLEDAFIKPDGQVLQSPFVRYVMQLSAAPTPDGKMTPLIMSKGFNYYLLDLKGSKPDPDATNYYYKRHVFGQSQTFGSLTAVSHCVPALFAVKDLTDSTQRASNLAYIKTALDALSAAPATVEDWATDAAWSMENSAKLQLYIAQTVDTVKQYVDQWTEEGSMDNGWEDFLKALYQPMLNTFFLTLLSEAKALFGVISDWAEDSRFGWERAICAIAFTTDNPLSGKPSSDLSLVTSAEYYLMRAFLIKSMGVSDGEIEVKDDYASYSGATENIPQRIFAFPTAVPGTPSYLCPANPVDITDGDATPPNSVLLGTSPVSQYWATIAQRKLADGLFPNIGEMGEEDAAAKGFYDLLRRPQFGLRYTLVKEIAAYYIENGSIEDMSCPFSTGLW